MATPAPPTGHPFWKVFQKLTEANVWLYRVSKGRLGNHLPGYPEAPIILLHHVGAKSGTHRVSPVNSLPDGDRWIIVASKGGTDKHPAWFHNLKANPETTVQVGAERRRVRARVATADERARLWPLAVASYSSYDDYQRKAPREIPMVILERSSVVA